MVGIAQEAPRAALGTEYSKLSGTMKIGEIGRGKSRLPKRSFLQAAFKLPGVSKQQWAAFPPPDFVYFHCARKLAIFRP